MVYNRRQMRSSIKLNRRYLFFHAQSAVALDPYLDTNAEDVMKSLV